MTLAQWVEKLGGEHKELNIFWEPKEFKTNITKELSIMKNQPQEVWDQAYDFYKFCVKQEFKIIIN